MRQLENVSFFHFLELQSLFEAFFSKECLLFSKSGSKKIKLNSYNSNLIHLVPRSSKMKYNLIISNPPILKKVRIGWAG